MLERCNLSVKMSFFNVCAPKILGLCNWGKEGRKIAKSHPKTKPRIAFEDRENSNLISFFNKHFDCKTYVWNSELSMILSCACFGPRNPPSSTLTIYVAQLKKQQQETILISLVMTRCRAEIRTLKIPDNERMLYVLRRHSRGFIPRVNNKN